MKLNSHIIGSPGAQFFAVARDELMPYLKNGKQYILSEYGHGGDIIYRNYDAYVKATTSYYSKGEADMSGYKSQVVDFTPQRSYPQLAKIAIGSLVGVILLITGIVFLARHLIRQRRKKKLLKLIPAVL